MEALNTLLAPSNLPAGILLLFVFGYWILVLIGAADTEFLDIDVDTDVDLDLDVAADLDIDADASIDPDASVDWLNSALAFFNLGQIPFMIFLTFWIMPTWAITVLVNDALGNSNFFVGLLVLAGSLVVSAFIAKFLTMPFVRFFAHAQKDDFEAVQIGQTCQIVSGGSKGQARVVTSGSPHLINVRAWKGLKLERGSKAIILEYDATTNLYLVESIL